MLNLYTVGRIRNTPESDEEDDNDGSVLSLGLFPGEYLEIPGDDRCMFRFEAAWDSSLHNSPLLNRISANGEQIFITISAYLEVSYYYFFTLRFCIIFVHYGIKLEKIYNAIVY